jgi:hypothetical protein
MWIKNSKYKIFVEKIAASCQGKPSLYNLKNRETAQVAIINKNVRNKDFLFSDS